MGCLFKLVSFRRFLAERGKAHCSILEYSLCSAWLSHALFLSLSSSSFPLFSWDFLAELEKHSLKVMDQLGEIIEGLDNLDSLM